MRHGHANNALTKTGVKQVEESGNRLREELKDLEEITIYHSPYRRAQESAEVLAKSLEPIKAYLEPRGELACDMDEVGNLAQLIKDEVSIFVSHAPDICDYLHQKGKDIYPHTAQVVKVTED